MTDAYTAWEHAKQVGTADDAASYFAKGPKWTYLGDGNNVAHSLVLAAARLGARITLACPEGYDPDPKIIEGAKSMHPLGADAVEVTRNATAAISGASMVYTDTWVSMGQEGDRAGLSIEDIFGPYQVNDALMKHAADDAVFMHCLPAIPGQEMTAEVLRGGRSIVLDQAENRLWTVQALLARWVFA